MKPRTISGGMIRSVLMLALLGASAALVAPARAAVTLSVEPALVEFEAAPGGVGSQTITIANDGDEAIDLTTAVEPYRAATDDWSAVGWLTVSPADVRLEPGQRQTVEVAIAVPDGLAAGGRYALVTFTTAARSVAGSGTAMAGKLGVAFLFNVDGTGELTRSASLERFAPTLEPDGRIGFRALLSNDGNQHVFPRGAVALTSEDGTPLASLEFPPTTPLLPASVALLVAQGSLPLPLDGEYAALATIDYGGDEPAVAELDIAPRVDLRVAGVAVCENLDRGPTLRVSLQNEGTLGLLPLVQVSLRRADGSPLGAAPPSPPTLLWPDETVELALEVPERLVSGEYMAAVRVDYALPDAEGRTVLPPVEQDVPFRIGGLDEGAAPLCVGDEARG